MFALLDGHKVTGSRFFFGTHPYEVRRISGFSTLGIGRLHTECRFADEMLMRFRIGAATAPHPLSEYWTLPSEYSTLCHGGSHAHSRGVQTTALGCFPHRSAETSRIGCCKSW